MSSHLSLAFSGAGQYRAPLADLHTHTHTYVYIEMRFEVLKNKNKTLPPEKSVFSIWKYLFGNKIIRYGVKRTHPEDLQ